MLRLIVGIIGILAGIALGAYVGIYLCLIGGIMGLVAVFETMQSGAGIDAFAVAWNIVKIIFAGFAGGVSAYVLIIPSFAYLSGGYLR